MRSQQTAALLLGIVSSVYAGVQKTCPSSNLCYSLNIPDTTASSGNGDIYMQISAPTSYGWVALGQGGSMSGAQMFVVYTDASGDNVTVSPRLGSGHSEPSYSSSAQVTLLDGSGVSNGVMTANIKCASCSSWSGGKMDFSASSTNWIFAAYSGAQIKSDSPSSTISQHQGTYGTLSFGTSAKGGSDVNPFTASNSTTTTTGSGSGSGSSCKASSSSGGTATTSNSSPSHTSSGPFGGWGGSWGHPSSFPNGNPYNKRADDDCSTDSGQSLNQYSSAAFERRQNMLIAHGVMAALAMVIFFPFGAIMIRLMSFPGLVWFHAVFQVLAFVVYLVAFGLGIYIANSMGYLSQYHPIIGIVIFILLCVQPVLGFLHHSAYRKYQRRTMWSYGHLWNGRTIITLGIINGGLGFKLANNSKTGAIAYGVIAAIVYLIYLASIFIGERKRRSSSDPPKYEDAVSPSGSGRSRRTGRRGGSSTSSPAREYYGMGNYR
jgi:hypothetical protein